MPDVYCVFVSIERIELDYNGDECGYEDMTPIPTLYGEFSTLEDAEVYANTLERAEPFCLAP